MPLIPMRSSYSILAIIFRTAAVVVLLYGLFTYFTTLSLGAGLSPSAGALFVRLVLVHIVAAVILWVIAKPVAALIVRGVE